MVRTTPLVERVLEEVTRLGVGLVDSNVDGAFVLADLSGLDTEAAIDLLAPVHAGGHRSLSIWNRGGERFLGPWAEPRRSSCWNCCRLRFFDSVVGDGRTAIEPGPDAVRVLARNVLLAVRYPDLAPAGCVLVDDGVTSTLHSVVPMPWCELCGGAVEMIASSPAPPTRSLLVPTELRLLADPRGGIVRHLYILDGQGRVDALALPRCASATIGPYDAGGISFPSSNGEGKGATMEAAVGSAIGEGLERYAASLWDPAALLYKSFDELGDQAFDPRELVLYDREQYATPGFAFAPFDPGRAMHWVAGRWLDTGDPVALPALATYMNFPVEWRDQFGQTSSNGLAAGASFEDAARRALYELIERDAFMLAWLAKRPGVRLGDDGCDAVTAQALEEVHRVGARTELYLVDVGTEHPTVVCLGLGDGQSWPGVTVGLAAHADVDVALQRAVLEHGHCGSYIQRLMREDRHREIVAPAQVTTGLDHALYYIDPSRATALDAFRAGAGSPVPLAEMRARYRHRPTLAACVAALARAGIRAAAVDVTSPDVALAPIRVVRAFGTYMQPIHFGVGNERLRNPRLQRWLSGPAESSPHPLA
ncbi:MAG: YcaO-like family protein [Actinomycetota bacterium]|nr:YcaO-like family protein [Actinomycetota bacterium]